MYLKNIKNKNYNKHSMVSASTFFTKWREMMRGGGVNDVDGGDILSPKDVGATRGIELQACGDHDLKVSWRRTSPILLHNNSFVLTKSCFSNEVDWYLFVIGQKLDKSIEKNCHMLCHVCIFPSPVFFRESKLYLCFPSCIMFLKIFNFF